MFDQRLQVKWNNFVTTVDSKFIVACGYPDNSLRVIETDAGKIFFIRLQNGNCPEIGDRDS